MSVVVAAALFAQLVVVGADPATCRAHKSSRAVASDAAGELSVREMLERKSQRECVQFIVPAHLLDVRATSLAAAGIALHEDKVVRVDGPPAPPTVSDADLEHGITCATPGHCVIDRKLLDRLLADTTALATSARLVPSVRDGKPDGFRLFAIHPGSVWSRLGFENGDTIQTINGLDMTSPEKALEIYTKLRNATDMAVRIVRRGQPQTLSFEIR